MRCRRRCRAAGPCNRALIPLRFKKPMPRIDDLSKRTGLPKSDIKVVSVEAVQWPDTSLGCPQPDMMYAEVVTPGYRIAPWKPAARCMNTIPPEPVSDFASPKNHDLPTVAARIGVTRPNPTTCGPARQPRRHPFLSITARRLPPRPRARRAPLVLPADARGRLHPSLIVP